MTDTEFERELRKLGFEKSSLPYGEFCRWDHGDGSFRVTLKPHLMSDKAKRTAIRSFTRIFAQ